MELYIFDLEPRAGITAKEESERGFGHFVWLREGEMTQGSEE
jgi:hypothetical protein